MYQYCEQDMSSSDLGMLSPAKSVFSQHLPLDFYLNFSNYLSLPKISTAPLKRSHIAPISHVILPDSCLSLILEVSSRVPRKPVPAGFKDLTVSRTGWWGVGWVLVVDGFLLLLVLRGLFGGCLVVRKLGLEIVDWGRE